MFEGSIFRENMLCQGGEDSARPVSKFQPDPHHVFTLHGVDMPLWEFEMHDHHTVQERVVGTRRNEHGANSVSPFGAWEILMN